MSELQVAEPTEVLVPLDVRDAERLDKRLRLMVGTARENFEKVGRLLDEAKQGRAHDVLGFKSWTAYVADVLGGTLQLSGEARQTMLQLMSAEGMSVRAISAATGVSKSTVDRDLVQVSHNGTPQGFGRIMCPTIGHITRPEATVTGIDGKTYTKPKRKPQAKKEPQPKPAPKPEPAKERRPQIRTVFRENIDSMDRLYQETYRLHTDPRWKNTTLAARDISKLAVLITGLQQLQAMVERAEESA